MSTLTPGANTTLPPAGQVSLTLRTAAAHADLVALCVRGDGTADGDNGVALWSQPVCAGGAVRIDPGRDLVQVDLRALPGDVQRLLIVAQADGVPDLGAAGSLTVDAQADGSPAVQLLIDPAPAFPTVQVAEVYRHSSGWKVRCLGDGYADGLAKLLTVHGIDVTDDDSASAPAPAAPPAPVASSTPAAPSFPPSAPATTPSYSPPAAPAPSAPGPTAAPSGLSLEKQRQAVILQKAQASGSMSLVKKVEAAAVSLQKQGLVGQRAQVVLVLDVSGSARPLFKDGRYQALIERALAAGLLFDDDGTIQAWLFDQSLHEAPDITIENHQSWAKAVHKRRDIWGLTKYAPPIQQIAGQVGRGARVPTYVMFITDGGNSDRRPAAAALQEASGTAVFWQFMAVGREQDFPFLQKLDDLRGREVDNADFFAVENPAAVPDQAFFDSMMREFPQWISAARAAGILRA